MNRTLAFLVLALFVGSAHAQGSLGVQGDITSVTPVTGGGTAGGGTRGPVTFSLLMSCGSDQVLKWSGSAWACADDEIGAPGSGDIESVTAGDGLIGGGTTGAVTLNVAVGTGLAVLADVINLNLAAQDCVAGSFFDSNTTTGTFTCVAEVGDVSGVTVTSPACSAGSFMTTLTGGASSGAVAVGGTCTAETGDISNVSVSGPISGGGATGSVTIGMTNADYGDITTSGATPSTTWTVDNDAITYGKIQNVVADDRFLGRISGASGDIEELTGTQATTLIDVGTSALKGLAPASGGGTTNFLRADFTWAAPSGGISGLTTNTIPKATSATTIGNSSVTDNGTTVATTISTAFGDNSASDTTTILGATSVTSTSGGGTAMLVTQSGAATNYALQANAGGTSAQAIRGVVNDAARTTAGFGGAYYNAATYNTTSGAITSYGNYNENTATRSAGANNLTNIAVGANASGGQLNYSFYGAAGSFYNAGNASFAADAAVSGTTTTGDFRSVTITPTTLTASVNDYAPASLSTAGNINVSSNAGWSITGLTGGAEGRRMTIYNIGTEIVYLIDQSASSTAANRFNSPWGGSATVEANNSVDLIYTNSRWHILVKNGRFQVSGYFTDGLISYSTFAAYGTSSVIGDATTDVLTLTATLDDRINYSGTAPTLGSCAGCTLASYSTNARGRMTCTDGSTANTCTITFAGTPYTTNPPVCWVQFERNAGAAADAAVPVPTIIAYSTSAFSWKQVTAGAHGYAYGCDGML